MGDKVKMDAPFVERTAYASGARRYGSAAASFVERRLDLGKAKSGDLAKAMANRVALQKAEIVTQNRDNNHYDTIYFVGSEDGFPLKIGITCCSWRRLSQLQVGSWEKLVLHGALWAHSNNVRPIEREAHWLARQANILERGEWVWATLPSAVELVIEAAARVRAALMTPAMVLHNQGMAMLARDRAVLEADARYHDPTLVKAA